MTTPNDDARDGSTATTTVVVMGVSGSGKTTIAHGLAQRLGWDFAEGDDFHPMANVRKMRDGHPLDDEDRWPWLRALADWIGGQEQSQVDAVVTCSALKRSYRDRLRDGHPSLWFAHVHAAPEVLLDRVVRRTGHYMPPALLSSQLAILQPLDVDEPGVTLDAGRSPDEVVAELTSALAAAGRLSPPRSQPFA